MADRSVLTTSTFNDFRREVNGTARDIGDISNLLSASGYIASSTDVIESIIAINAEVDVVKTDSFIFPGRTMVFEGATDDAFETTISFTEPTADRTHTLPDGDGEVILVDATQTGISNKTITTPTITSPVLNTGVLDEDDMSSNSATKVATQQSIKAYIDNSIDTEMDVNIATDSGSIAIITDSETLTVAGGDNITTAASGNTVTFNLSNDVVTLTGTQTLSNKTFNSPTTISAHTFSSGTTTAGMSIGANGIVFEGATADAHETTLTAVDPTQDNTITIPDATMTAITTATHATKATHIARAIALG